MENQEFFTTGKGSQALGQWSILGDLTEGRLTVSKGVEPTVTGQIQYIPDLQVELLVNIRV